MKGHLEHSFYLGPRPGAKGMAGVGGGGGVLEGAIKFEKTNRREFSRGLWEKGIPGRGKSFKFSSSHIKKRTGKGKLIRMIYFI